MKKQISSISIHQTSKIFAVLYGLIGLLYSLLGVIMLFSEKTRAGGIVFLLMPIIMAVTGYIGIAITAFVYNLVASRLGGIEFEVRDAE